MSEEKFETPVESEGLTIRFLNFAVNSGGLISAVATFILMVHIITDVALRYIANAPLPATIEIVSFWWMVLITFPALALTQRRQEHVNVSLMTDLMPDQHRKFSIIGARFVTLIVVLLLAWYGWSYALEQMARGEIAVGSITVPIWPTRFAVPLGMMLFAFQLTADLIWDVRNLTEDLSK